MKAAKVESAALVVFGYYDKNELQQVRFYVSGNELWSAEGLARVFNRTRASFLCGPTHESFDEDAWGSWHLLKAEEDPQPEAFVFV